MRPGGTPQPARALAVRLLAEIEAGGWSDRLLQARERTLADPRDRGLLHTLVLGTLRWQGALDARLAPVVRGGLAGLEPVVRAALRAGAADGHVLGRPVPIAVDAAVEAVRTAGSARSAGLVNAVLRRALADRAPLDPRLTVPAWLLARWDAALGRAATDALLVAINTPARPFLVPLPGTGSRDDLARDLAADGVSTAPAAFHPEGLAVTSGAPQATEAFAAGRFVLLDEAAALVARLAAPAPDDRRPAADLAAAPGGKASLLAAAAPGGLVALELHGGRAARLAATLAGRAGTGRAAVVRADAGVPPLAAGRFGTVLLDAPCSGTGTLRRRPDKRFRLQPADVAGCAARQERLLDAAAALVAPGGALVYSVCSLEPEEGAARVAAFLARHPGFVPEDPRPRLGPAAALVEGDPPLLRTVPGRADLDGFVAARMVRQP